MTAKSTAGIRVSLSGARDDASKFTEVIPTAISKAFPPVVTVTDVAGITEGEAVTFTGAGFAELELKPFIVGKVDSAAHTFEILGVDLTASKGALGTAPKADVYKMNEETFLCLSSLALAKDSPTSISVGTFCDPTASLPGNATTHGNVTMGGYVDVKSADYQALVAAETDGKERILKIELPGNNGYIVGRAIISGLTWELPLNGAIGFTASATLASKPHHVFGTTKAPTTP